MTDAAQIQSGIANVTDQASLLKFLEGVLGWPTGGVERVEDISFSWTAEELRSDDLTAKLVEGGIWQIRPLHENQPWGIFILEFRNAEVFEKGRGLTGPLRKVLRGLVPSRRRDSSLAAWKREHLLFICTHNYEHYRFAYFKTPKGDTRNAPLATFGWSPGEPARTVCEYNLSALAWPEDPRDAEKWVEDWAVAFDVERVTKRFYQEYKAIFDAAEATVAGATKLQGEDLRLFTQALFNRLMFLRFVEKKGWLKFNGRTDYLRALYEAGPVGGQSFYRSRLEPLFFEGLAVEGRGKSEAVGDVPFLNGGLFEKDALDRRVKDLPDRAFAGLIGRDGLFYRYNFTVEESTPLDIEVAVDPEMLGKVFEELVTGRHETGSYYTPRPVVSFMCREALKGYLEERADLSAEAAAALVDKKDVSRITQTQARCVVDALDNLKAVDPACGSGAYLLGLMHEMLAIYDCLYSESLKRDSRSIYELKLHIISNNLYGVDIDPFATNVAMLRLWLSIAVDCDKPLPLPNLEFKIETGDSLLGPNPSELSDFGSFLLRERAQRLVGLKEQYLTAHGEKKGALRERIRREEEDIESELQLEHGRGVIDWHVQFTEVFGENGGFDIVVANPPYVRQELIKELKPSLKKTYDSLYQGTADLYVYFYIRAIQLLAPGGMLVFISSNKWFRAAYGKKLRKYVAENCEVKSITDFRDLPVFESATAYPMIFVAAKSESEQGPLFTLVESLEEPYPDIAAVIASQGGRLPVSATGGADWRLMDAGAAARIEKMKSAGVALGEYVKGKIYYGIKTGFNRAFVIDGETRKRLIKEDPKSAEIIKPLAMGADIKRWRIEPSDRWLIVTPIGIVIDEYPAILKHLSQWEDQLKRRYDKGRHWWELRACSYYNIFERPKIMWGNLGLSPGFSYSFATMYTIAPANVVPTDNLYLLGLLNSGASEQFFADVAIERSGNYLEFKPMYVSQFPVPEASASDRKYIAALAQKCLDKKGIDCEEEEAQINERVTALYGL